MGVLGIACFPLTLLGSWFTVNQNEEAVILSYGSYAETIKDPGMKLSNMWGRDVRKISTKQQSIELPKTTVVDSNGNPLIISAVIVYRIANARRAVLDVENSYTFVRNQTEAEQISRHLCNLLQRKVLQAGALVDSFQLKEI